MFISIEGLDGSGKTTVVEAIEEEYGDVAVTAEPSEQWTGEQVRECLQSEETAPLTDFYSFLADRVEHIERVVKPVDNSGGLAVSDRYADSTRAYQPVALAQGDRFASQESAREFIDLAMMPLAHEPDVTIYLDVSVDTALERSAQQEKYEKRQFLEDVKSNYDDIIEEDRDRFVVIDAEQSKEEVAQQAVSKIDLPSLDRI